MSHRCVWYQCYNPPLPEHNANYNKLKLLWDPTKPVDFNANISYSCNGFSDQNNTFFEHDRNLDSFSIQCQDDGYFRVPEKWFRCVTGISYIHGQCKKKIEKIYQNLKFYDKEIAFCLNL